MTQKKEKEKQPLQAKNNETVEKAEANQTSVCSRPAGSAKKTALIVLLFVITIGIWGVVFKYGYEKYFSKTETTPSSTDPVVASVNADPIYLSDIRDFAAGIPQLSELPFEMIYPRLLEAFVNQDVLLKGAEQMNLEKDPEIVSALQMTRDQILSQAFLARQLESLITPEKLKELYDEELKNFVPEDEIHARHILVKTQKEANDIIVQLDAGADFAMLADKKSLDANGRGGDLGYFTKGMMIPEFSDVAFKLKKGQISDPVKTPFGWHVILVEDVRQVTPPAFEDVKEQLQQAFVDKNAQQVLAETRKKMNVQVLIPTLISNPAPETVEALSDPEEDFSEKAVPDVVEQNVAIPTEIEAVPVEAQDASK